MDREFEVLNGDEVVFVRSGRVLVPNPTFKVSELLDALAQLVSEQEDEWSEEQEGWFSNRGLACEVLRFNNPGWQRGRVRIRLEFAPERPKLLRESPPLQEDTYQPKELFLRRSREDVYGRDPNPNKDWTNSDDVIDPDFDDNY